MISAGKLIRFKSDLCLLQRQKFIYLLLIPGPASRGNLNDESLTERRRLCPKPHTALFSASWALGQGLGHCCCCCWHTLWYSCVCNVKCQNALLLYLCSHLHSCCHKVRQFKGSLKSHWDVISFLRSIKSGIDPKCMWRTANERQWLCVCVCEWNTEAE